MKVNRQGPPARTDNRFVATAAFVQHLLRRQGELAFSPSQSTGDFMAWKRQVRRKLRELLAFPRVPRQPGPRRLSDCPRGGYRLQRWELYPEPFCAVPMLVLVPDGASPSSPAPAVLCFPGSEQPKESLCGEPWEGPWKNRHGEHQFMALHFVRKGFVTVAMDNPATCETLDAARGDWRRAFGELLWLGRTYESLSTFQKLAALRWVRTLPFVDRGRIAACGHSLGAKPALLLGVLDAAIRAVIWNDHASNWREQIVATNLTPVAPWHYIPGFARWFDYIDLMCALAPTPLLITEGGCLRDHARIRQAYRLAGAGGNVKVSFMPNFRDPARRCRGPLPEGIDSAAYARHANFDKDHYFKDDVAVPWLDGRFGTE